MLSMNGREWRGNGCARQPRFSLGVKFLIAILAANFFRCAAQATKRRKLMRISVLANCSSLPPKNSPLLSNRIQRCTCAVSLLRLFLAGLFAFHLCNAASGAERSNSEPIRLEVDARDIPRQLLHARMEISARPGKLILWYPKWM